MINNGKYFVGKLKDHDYGRGWFFGRFVKEKLLRSDLVEIAYQKLDKIKIENESYPHYHKKALEINIVINGSCNFKLNDKKITVKKGDFYVIYPDVQISNYHAEKNTATNFSIACG